MTRVEPAYENTLEKGVEEPTFDYSIISIINPLHSFSFQETFSMVDVV